MGLAKTWFSLDGKISRRTYVLSGLGLMGVKYLLDGSAIYLAEGRILDPLSFLSPLLTTRQEMLQQANQPVLILMTVWALVFMWIGVSMSVRRAVDAGRSPWLGFLFVMPFINFLMILWLSIEPTNDSRPWEFSPVEPSKAHAAKSAIVGVGAGFGIAAVMGGLGILLLREYGLALFFATPFLMGAISSYVYNKDAVRTHRSSLGVGVASVALGSGALLLFALEGILCVSMAFPIVAGAGLLGASIGRSIAVRHGGVVGLFPLLVALPLMTAMESQVPEELGLREVATSIEIDAPPEAVWPHVVSFSELPPPHQLVFRTGIAYPVRARIEGTGPGAIRHCEFSTGAFVEPITAWDPPKRLAFDVASQPPPMQEWSPYRQVHPPHLDGYLKSRRGEFRLIPLPNGRTRLEGSTWYTLDLHPGAYWALWSDALIHRIHERVLEHISRETALSR